MAITHTPRGNKSQPFLTTIFLFHSNWMKVDAQYHSWTLFLVHIFTALVPK